jgi:hypothetical protein
MLHLLLKFSVLNQSPHNLSILRFMLKEHVIQLHNELISKRYQTFLNVVIEVELRLK